MSNMESNKIFAAVLTAGIVAALGNFFAEQIVSPHMPAEDAVQIVGIANAAGGGAAGPSGPEPIMALIAAADIAKGEKLSKACAACHSFDQGGANKVGPNLYGVVGAAKGHVAGFEYSAGMKEKGGAWDYDSLNHFLYKPKDYIKGTKMTYAGLKKPEDRAAMIAWLRTLGSSLPMPTEAQIKTEQEALAPPAPALTDAPAADTPAGADAPATPPAAEAAPATKTAH